MGNLGGLLGNAENPPFYRVLFFFNLPSHGEGKRGPQEVQAGETAEEEVAGSLVHKI